MRFPLIMDDHHNLTTVGSVNVIFLYITDIGTASFDFVNHLPPAAGLLDDAAVCERLGKVQRLKGVRRRGMPRPHPAIDRRGPSRLGFFASLFGNQKAGVLTFIGRSLGRAATSLSLLSSRLAPDGRG